MVRILISGLHSLHLKDLQSVSFYRRKQSQEAWCPLPGPGPSPRVLQPLFLRKRKNVIPGAPDVRAFQGQKPVVFGFWKSRGSGA